MKVIGLTGSIGMGKSAAANMLRVMKIPVFDSDACVHDLLSGRAAPLIRGAFPQAWDTRTQRIDRHKLGQIVFRNPKDRRTLESILHPMVWQAQRDFIAAARRAGKRIVVLDIPLLFETGSERKCDQVICVTAPFFLQKTRVLRRPNMTEDKFYAILREQLDDRSKCRLATHVVPTGAGRRTTFSHLKKLVRILRTGHQP